MAQIIKNENNNDTIFPEELQDITKLLGTKAEEKLNIEINFQFVKDNRMLPEAKTYPLIKDEPLHITLGCPEKEYFYNKNPYILGANFVINLLHELRHGEQKIKLYQTTDETNLKLAIYDLIVKTTPILGRKGNWDVYTNNPNEVDADLFALKKGKYALPQLIPHLSQKDYKSLILNNFQQKIKLNGKNAVIPPRFESSLLSYRDAIKSGESKLKKTLYPNIDFQIENPRNNALYAIFLRMPENDDLKRRIENEPNREIAAKAIGSIIGKLQPKDFDAYGVLQNDALKNKITNPDNERHTRRTHRRKKEKLSRPLKYITFPIDITVSIVDTISRIYPRFLC